MYYYLFIFTFSLFTFSLSYDKHTCFINNKIVALLFSVFLILICGLRFGIGTDYWNYYKHYVGTSEAVERIEPGFRSLISFSSYIKPNNFAFFVLFIAVLSVGLKSIYFSKLENPFFAILIYLSLFYFPLDFNVIRQGLASALIYFAVEEGKKKHLGRYILLVFIASTFHLASIVFISLYQLCRVRFSIKMRNVIVIFFIFLILRVTLLQFIFDSIRTFIISKYSIPVVLQLVNYFWLDSFSLSLNFFRRLFFIIIYLLLFGSKNLNCYFLLYLMSFFISTMLTGNEIFAYRLSAWFDIFLIPLFCSEKIKLTNRNAFVLLCFILSLILMFFLTMRDALPYQVSWGRV